MMLDHIVINTLPDMDRAEGVFRDLGFGLTPRGYHSLGSINHLMMVPGAYLELVGVPATGLQRQDVLDSPRGLSGLVLRSGDAEATCRRLAQAGLHPKEPILLERPVTIDGQEHMARFRNLRMTGQEFPAGRVYFCQHLTPELVWRDAWLHHPNGFCGFDSITVHSPDPVRAAENYAILAETRAVSQEGAQVIADDGFRIRLQQGNADRFDIATLRFGDLADIANRAERAEGVSWHREQARAGVLDIPFLDLRLRCLAD